MTAEKIRCDKDILLANALLEAPEVKRVNRWVTIQRPENFLQYRS